jgi:hypothetical protein
MDEVEKMYQRALQGKEKARSLDHTSTKELSIRENLFVSLVFAVV